MSETIAKLRAAGTAKSFRTDTIDVILNQKLAAKAHALVARKHELERAIAEDAQSEEAKRTRKAAAKNPLRAELDEVEKHLADVNEQAGDSRGTLTLTAIQAGEWLRWRDQNPADDDNKHDTGVLLDVCSLAALVEPDSLERFMTAWNDEPLTAEDKGWLLDDTDGGIDAATRQNIARKVVFLHEMELDLPKLPTASSATKRPATA